MQRNGMAVDVLNILWEALFGYAYSYIFLISKMVQKMRIILLK